VTRSEPIPEIATVHVPFRLVKRGGRREMQLPEGAAQSRGPDSTLVKALARAFRWKQMLESGEFATITELAERERLTLSFVTRVLRMTLLAPDLVEAILDGKQGSHLTLATAIKSIPAVWEVQESTLGSRLKSEPCPQRDGQPHLLDNHPLRSS
jgi:hypothetical protein